MAAIQTCELPRNALLRRYLDDRDAYTDCYVTELARPVQHAQFVEAFYTTVVFKLERWLLSWLVARPSTDAEAKALAAGELASFAAWNVEARASAQVLMADFRGRTRSWLMSATSPGAQTTRLYFGSAVVPVADRRTGQKKLGSTYRLLLGFHQLYSRVLLRAAVHRLDRSNYQRA
jgi:hypothetical protein